ncbi:MAG: DUF2802 domain-containing protein [Rhodanobacter sp.]
MWLGIALGVLLLIALVQCAALVALWRQFRRQHEGLRGAIDRYAQQALHGSTDVPTSMLVTAMGQLERRVAMLDLPPAAAASPSYDLAQQLAREGADVTQLVERCGLSRDEADLIVQMHSATR